MAAILAALGAVFGVLLLTAFVHVLLSVRTRREPVGGRLFRRS